MPCRAESQGRRNTSIEHRVVSGAILNDSDAGKKQASIRYAFTDKPGNDRKVRQLDAVVRFRQRLIRMARGRQKSRIRYTQNLCVESVDINIFESRTE